MELSVDGRPVFLHQGGVDTDFSDGVVVLVHGAGDDHSVWRYQTRWLAAAGYPVAAVDLPGHGRSEGPPFGSIPDLAGWIVRVVEELGARTVALVGHSMGSLVAVQVAADHPDLVTTVVLVAPAARMYVHPDLLEAARTLDPLAADLIVGWSHTGRDRLGGHVDPGVWKPAATRRLLERHADVLGADLEACAAWDGTVAARVASPTLVVVGGADRMTPAREGRALAAAIETSQVVELEGASHPMHSTRPDELNPMLRDWLGLQIGSSGISG